MVDVKHSRDESIFVRETYRVEPSSSSVFSCWVPWNTAPGVGGYPDICHPCDSSKFLLGAGNHGSEQLGWFWQWLRANVRSATSL